jgi:hypothetical protein
VFEQKERLGKPQAGLLCIILARKRLSGEKNYAGRSKKMKTGFQLICLGALGFALAVCCWGQSTPEYASAEAQKTNHKVKKTRTPGKEMGKGGEDIGVGAAKGAGDLAKGTAGSVGNLARGNVGGAGASFGKGVGGLGKNVGVGTGKGMAKIGKGLGGEFKKLGGKSKRHDEKDQQLSQNHS